MTRGKNEAITLEGIRTLLHYVGEDPARDGLQDTPNRVLRAFLEMTSGYSKTAEDALSTEFSEKHDEMVVVTKLRFSSLCEHHLLPFVGHVTFGYIPDGKVVGLSKIPRLVEVYSKRLQIQERMTDQIAGGFWRVASPKGVGVIVTAQHQCMSCRGVKQQDAEMVTSSLLGQFMEGNTRAEFLQYHRGTHG